MSLVGTGLPSEAPRAPQPAPPPRSAEVTVLTCASLHWLPPARSSVLLSGFPAYLPLSEHPVPLLTEDCDCLCGPRRAT